MWTTLIWPLIPFLLQIGVIAFWGVVAVFLASIGREPDPSKNNITLANGTIDTNAVKAQVQGLFSETGVCDDANVSLFMFIHCLLEI